MADSENDKKQPVLTDELWDNGKGVKTLAIWASAKHELILGGCADWYHYYCNKQSGFITATTNNEAIAILQSRIDAGDFHLYNGELKRIT